MANISNNNNNNNNNNDNDSNTIIVTKFIFDFDDCLFPSHRYKAHEILKYHESTSSEPVQTGRDLFKNQYETNFMTLKKNIDLVIFKLMQQYKKDNFVILSTGDYQWIESTLKYYDYLLSAYKIEIYSTQQWAKHNPNDFNSSNSLQGKSFLMKYLLNKWRKEEEAKYNKNNNENKKIKFRLISIGDSFFEFLACYNIGYDFVNRIKLIEEPTVDQLINLWSKILYLCDEKIFNSNVVFLNDEEYYYLDQNRMNSLNQQCVDRVNRTKNLVWKSLFDIITNDNPECYEIKMDVEGKQYKNKKIQTSKTQTISTFSSENSIENKTDQHNDNDYNDNNDLYHNHINNGYNDNNFYILSSSQNQTTLNNINNINNENMNNYNNNNRNNNNTIYNINYNIFVPLTAPINNNNNNNDIDGNQLFYSQQQLFYAQQLLQQHQQMQSQFIIDVPQYTNLNYSDSSSVPINYTMTNPPLMTSYYTTNT